MHAGYLFSDVDDADATHEEPGARSVISGVPVRMRVASGDLRRPLSSLLSDELHLPVYSVAALTLQWKCASRTFVTSVSTVLLRQRGRPNPLLATPAD